MKAEKAADAKVETPALWGQQSAYLDVSANTPASARAKREKAA